MHVFGIFFRAVFVHVASWVGGVLTVLAVLEMIIGKKIVIRARWVLLAGVALLFVGSYQAWLDEYRSVRTLIGEKADLASQVAKMQEQLGRKPPMEYVVVPSEPNVSNAACSEMAVFIKQGVRLRDRASRERGASINLDWERWRRKTERAVSDNFGSVQLETFRSYNIPSFALYDRIVNEIGDLERLASSCKGKD